MKKELVETEAIDNFLLNRLDREEEQAFQLRMLLDSSFFERVEAQSYVYKLVRRFSRAQKRKQLENIYRQLQQEASFAQQLQNIFA
jgi:hypothetical protein